MKFVGNVTMKVIILRGGGGHNDPVNLTIPIYNYIYSYMLQLLYTCTMLLC